MKLKSVPSVDVAYLRGTDTPFVGVSAQESITKKSPIGRSGTEFVPPAPGDDLDLHLPMFNLTADHAKERLFELESESCNQDRLDQLYLLCIHALGYPMHEHKSLQGKHFSFFLSEGKDVVAPLVNAPKHSDTKFLPDVWVSLKHIFGEAFGEENAQDQEFMLFREVFEQFNAVILAPCNNPQSASWITAQFQAFVVNEVSRRIQKDEKKYRDLRTECAAVNLLFGKLFEGILRKLKFTACLANVKAAICPSVTPEAVKLFEDARVLASRRYTVTELKAELEVDHPFYNSSTLSTQPLVNWRNFQRKTIEHMLELHEDHHLTHKDTKTAQGRILLVIHAARNLKDKDLVGVSDPYIYCEFHDDKYRSATVWDTTEPLWEHRIYLWDMKNTGDIKVSIFNENKLRDSFLGRVTLDVKQMASTKPYVSREWIPLEKRTIKSHVSGELCLSYRYVPFKVTTHTFDCVSLYRVLLQRSFLHENGVISSLSHRMLDAYTYRYHILPMYQAVCLLEAFSSRMSIEPSKIKVVLSLVHKILTMEQEISLRDGWELSCQEKDLFLKTLSSLYSFCCEVVIKMDCIPVLASLKLLLKLIQALTESLMFDEISRGSGLTSVTIFDHLLDKSVQHSYREIVVYFQDPIKTGSDQFGIAQLVQIGSRIHSQLESYFDLYAPEFAEVIVNFEKLVATGFIKQYYEHLISYQYKEEEDRDQPLMFELYFQARQVLILARTKLGPEADTLMPIHYFATPRVSLWIEMTRGKLIDWVAGSLRIDNWEPLSAEGLHSSSIVDLFSAIYQAYDFLLDLEWDYAGQTVSVFHPEFCSMVSGVMQVYTSSVCSLIKEEIDLVDESDSLSLTITLCTQLNSIHMGMKYFSQLISEMERQDSLELNTSLPWISDHLEEVIDLIVERMNVSIERDIFLVADEGESTLPEHEISEPSLFMRLKAKLFQHSDEEEEESAPLGAPMSLEGVPMTQLRSYIDEQFRFAMTHSYEPVFKHLMKGTWTSLVQDIQTVIIEADEDADISRALGLLEEMKIFFGGPESVIHRHLKRLSDRTKELIRNVDLRTDGLIAAHKKSSPRTARLLFRVLEYRARPLAMDKAAKSYVKKLSQ